jgi:hypothetical protein
MSRVHLPCSNVRISFFLRPNSILFYVKTTFCFSIHLSKDMGCFYFLTMVINGAMKWVFKYHFESVLLFLLVMYPEVVLLNHMVILCLIFLRNSYTIFHSSYAVFTLLPTVQGFCYLCILANTYVLGFGYICVCVCVYVYAITILISIRWSLIMILI